MAKFPPQFDKNRLYPRVYDLDKIDVLVEEANQGKYFTVSNLPSPITLGKHLFQISLNLAEDENGRRLKAASKVLFEFKDSAGNVIFSDLLPELISNDSAAAFVWIKEDPLRIYEDIADGVGSLTIVGELNNVPNQWNGKYNVRTIIPVQISKFQANNSQIVFKTPSVVLNDGTGSFSEFQANSPINENYSGSFLQISASNLETHGGMVDKVEISFFETGSQVTGSDGEPSYIVHDTITLPRGDSSVVYTDNMSASINSGMNPTSVNIITTTPDNIMIPTRLKFRLRYLNPAGQYATDVFGDNQVVTTDSDFVTINGRNFVVAGDGNIITGSVYIGESIGEGIEIHGGSSFIRSLGYKGISSGSAGSGSGFMIFSGSVLPNTAGEDNYKGVGMELIKHSGSLFTFHTDDGVGGRKAGLDIRTERFFVGNTRTAFISSSNGLIEISSSAFHLDHLGNVTLSGSVSASKGNIGGWEIGDSALSSSGMIIDSKNNTIYQADKGPGTDTDNNTDALLALRDEFYIDFSPEGENPDNAYVKFGPNFTVDKDGILIASGAKFVGTITASAGILGGFTIGTASIFSGDTNTPKFFMSGSPEGTNFQKKNLFISSSGFQVNADGAISSSVGIIGGFEIGKRIISSSLGNLILTDEGQITASSVLLSGSGTTGHIQIAGDDFFFGKKAKQFISGSGTKIEISSSGFHLHPSGDMTGSSALFDGDIQVTGKGKIANWVISGSSIKSDSGSQVQNINDGSGGSLTGIELHPDEGIIGRGVDWMHEYTANSGMFNFNPRTMVVSGDRKINGIRWGTTNGDKVMYHRTASSNDPQVIAYGGNEYGEASE